MFCFKACCWTALGEFFRSAKQKTKQLLSSFHSRFAHSLAKTLTLLQHNPPKTEARHVHGKEDTKPEQEDEAGRDYRIHCV